MPIHGERLGAQDEIGRPPEADEAQEEGEGDNGLVAAVDAPEVRSRCRQDAGEALESSHEIPVAEEEVEDAGAVGVGARLPECHHAEHRRRPRELWEMCCKRCWLTADS
eukprot:555553-Alexandrium_andersonii.AAC.1